MDDSMFFRTANVTRWNSKFHLVERVYEYRAVLEATAQELEQRKDVPKEERKKFKEFQSQLLSAEELDVLAEVIGLLRPAADFTHWAGGSDYTTISQVYEKVHNLLPPVTTLQTEGAQQMHMRLKLLIDSAWPLDDISDGMLLAMYFNPGCVGSEIWGLENINQVAENAAEDAAEAEAAIVTAVAASEAAAKTAKTVTQGAGQDLAQDPQDDPSNPFQDQNPDPPSGFDHLPEQLPYKRMRPKPTNRLRAETLVYRAIIQRQVDLAIEKRRSDVAGSSFNPINDADEDTVLRLAQVNAESCILAYRAALGNTTRSAAYFNDPLAFWRMMENMDNFTSLCYLARMYLTIQATSSESEDFLVRQGWFTRHEGPGFLTITFVT
ncbi:MAG: hypothetical protein J3R72DRAFT_430722 [Linnemannia gamsii]|nr:MAG: hypothetical protein J3R72DRAFT_430722 [Linnemannia gamsii]